MKNEKVFCIIALISALFSVIIAISYTFNFDTITNIFKSVNDKPPKPPSTSGGHIRNFGNYKTGVIPSKHLPKHQQIANVCEDCYRPFINVRPDDDFPGCKNCQVAIFNSPP